VVVSAPGLILRWVVHGGFHKNLDYFCDFCLLNPYCLQVLLLHTVQGFTSENQTATCAAAASQLYAHRHHRSTYATHQHQSRKRVLCYIQSSSATRECQTFHNKVCFYILKNIGTTLHLVKIKEVIYSNQQVLGHA